MATIFPAREVIAAPIGGETRRFPVRRGATGTAAGVGPVVRGNVLVSAFDGLGAITPTIEPAAAK